MTGAGANVSAGGWAESFAPFGWLHAATVLVCVVVTAAAVWAGRAGRHGRAERAGRRVAAGLGALLMAVYVGYFMMPGRFSWAFSLPLQVCDLAGMLAVVCLARPRGGERGRAVRTVLYFWGFGLSTQAFFTPIITKGPAYLHFWMFWLLHLLIVGTAVYVVAVDGYRPRWRDYAAAVGWTLVYGAVTIPMNVLMGSNYGYTGPGMPGQPTVVDALGAWPGRVGWIALLVLVAMAVTMLPWVVARRAGRFVYSDRA